MDWYVVLDDATRAEPTVLTDLRRVDEVTLPEIDGALAAHPQRLADEGRRARSALRLGWLWWHDCRRHGRLPLLLFRPSSLGWIARGAPSPKLSG